MKTILENIEECLSKPWNRGYLMTISNRLTGSKSYCVEVKNSKNPYGDKFFLKKEDCILAEEIINKYNKVRSDAQKERMQKIKQKALDKKAAKDKLDVDIDEPADLECVEDIEDIEEPEDDIPQFSEKLLEKKQKKMFKE